MRDFSSMMAGGRKIVISGSSGLIGNSLVAHFKEKGDLVKRLVRPNRVTIKENDIEWDPAAGKIKTNELEGSDIVIHLAGKNIAGGRWTSKVKDEIYSSRIEGTKLLCKALSGLKEKPKLLLCASATGFYGNCPPSEEITETGPKGEGFRCDLCEDWEKATRDAKEAGISVVNMRIGIVLASEGGTLKRILPVFKAGLGGKLGNGEQIISWISLREIPFIMEHIISREKIEGPVNFVSQGAVSNKEFTRILAGVLKRPAIFSVPSFVLRILYGQMADELLLSGARVVPEKILKSGYAFKDNSLEKCLSDILK